MASQIVGTRNDSDLSNFFQIVNNQIEVNNGVKPFGDPFVVSDKAIANFNEALATGSFTPDSDGNYDFEYNGQTFTFLVNGSSITYTNVGSANFSGTQGGEANYNLKVTDFAVALVGGELTRDVADNVNTRIEMDPTSSGSGTYHTYISGDSASSFDTYVITIYNETYTGTEPTDSLIVGGQFSLDETTGKVQGTVNTVFLYMTDAGGSFDASYTDLSVDFQGLMENVGNFDEMSTFLGHVERNIYTEGTPEDDVLIGTIGDDVSNGYAGDDVMQGGNGHDELNGGEGADMLTGHSGNDILNGGEGVDLALYSNLTTIEDVIYARQFSNGQVVVATEGYAGTDTLISIENIAFGYDADNAMSMSDFLALVPDIPPVGSVTFTGVGVNGEAVALPPILYDGPVAFLEFELLGASEGDTVTGSDFNDFINLLGGDDAANGGAGVDVLDGGTGSNFLTGGSGADTFFLDGRGGENTWSTIADFSGDNVNIWGWVEGVSALLLTQDLNGASGFQGVTFHYDLDADGAIDTSITFTGLTEEQVPGSSAETVADNGYLLFAA